MHLVVTSSCSCSSCFCFTTCCFSLLFSYALVYWLTNACLKHDLNVASHSHGPLIVTASSVMMKLHYYCFLHLKVTRKNAVITLFLLIILVVVEVDGVT